MILDGGVCIPESYSSFISPISSAILFEKTRGTRKEELFETPMVVKFRKVRELALPQKVWEFKHPFNGSRFPAGHPDFNVHNTRFATKEFGITDDTILVVIFN